jgi:hypothetical protein
VAVQTVYEPLAGLVLTLVVKFVQVYVLGATVPLVLILNGKQGLVQFNTKPPNTELTVIVGTLVLDVTETVCVVVQPVTILVNVIA